MSYDSVVLADSPLAYWKLEELTPPGAPPNNDCIDSSGNGRHGTLSPQPPDFIQGITGPILTDASSFGCSGVVARLPGTGNANAFTPVDDITWECWAKKTGTGTQVMIERGPNPTSDTYMAWGELQTGLFVDSAVWGLDWGSGVNRGLKSCSLENDTWYHVAGVRSGATMTLYVNGWEVDSRGDCPTTSTTPGNNPFRLGYVASVLGAIWWSQGLSHVAIYDTALSQAQLRVHVVAALGSLPENPCGDTPTISVGCPNAEGVVGEPYSSEVTVVGGTPPYTFEIISGTLPDGLTLDENTGAITGTPTTGGTFNFTVQVTDADLNTGESPGCQVVIDDVPPPPENPPMTHTFQFDAGVGSQWWLVPQLSDSGNELRSKNVKAVHVTGRLTNAEFIGYAYDVEQPINVAELEAGERSSMRTVTRPQILPDTTEVTQSKRRPINITGTLHTVRLSGDDTGNEVRDRIEEIVIEVSDQGVRR